MEEVNFKEEKYGVLPWLTDENKNTLTKKTALKWLNENKVKIGDNAYVKRLGGTAWYEKF